MDIKIYTPHPALQEYVLSISTVNAILPEGIDEVVNPYPPTSFQSLIFYCNHPVSMSRSDEKEFNLQPHTVLIGPQFSRVNVKVHQQLTAIRADFLPGGMYRMLGVPMHELFDAGFDALDFFGNHMRVVNDKLLNTSSLEEGKTIVENFLLKQIRNLKNKLPIDRTLKLLLKTHGTVSIETAASLSCLSLKQFERKCQERIGMNPKLYTRILRFSKAYRMHEAQPNLNWTTIAHEAGYYDQMHMIKDFKRFAGVNPSIIQQQLQSTPLRMQKDLHY